MKDTGEATEKFLTDDEFIEFVISGDEVLGSKWKEYLERNSSEKEAFHEAESVVRMLVDKGQESAGMNHNIQERIWHRLLKSKEGHFKERRSVRTISLVARIAAIFVLFIAIPVIYTTWIINEKEHLAELNVVDESDEVTLYLASGDRLMPDAIPENKTIHQGGNTFSKVESNTLRIIASESGVSNQDLYNTIIVPRGKRYNLVLQDGTKVWINSGSEFRFPENFREGSREVYLSGEAYFDVTKDPSSPFLVSVGDIDVEVAGTSFNVSAYKENDIIETTLVEGKVYINNASGNSTELRPDQMAGYNRRDQSIAVDNVDVSLYTTWKDGILVFRDEEIKILGPKIERWYDIDIIYRDSTIPELRLSGIIREEKSLEHVLGLIEKACQVSSSINGNKVILSKIPQPISIK